MRPKGRTSKAARVCSDDGISTALPKVSAFRRGFMSAPSILLIAMPWHALHLPSIQLGLLQSVLEGAGIQTEVATLGLAFLEHCYTATADLPDGARIQRRRVRRRREPRRQRSRENWIFSVPPFRDAPESDAKYPSAFLRSREVHDHTLQAALAMRPVGPGIPRGAWRTTSLPSVRRSVGFTSTFSQNVPSLVSHKILKLQLSLALHRLWRGQLRRPDGARPAPLPFPWVDVVDPAEKRNGVLPDVVRDLIADGTVRPQAGLCFQRRRHLGEHSPSRRQRRRDGRDPDAHLRRIFRAARRGPVSCPRLQQSVALLYETARGCWWGAKSHCTFCGLNWDQHGVPEQEPCPRSPGVDDARPALSAAGLSRSPTTSSTFRYSSRRAAPAVRARLRLAPLLRDQSQPATRAGTTPEEGRRRPHPTGHRKPQHPDPRSDAKRRHRLPERAAPQVVRRVWGSAPTWNILCGFPGEPPEEYASHDGGGPLAHAPLRHQWRAPSS